jgi:hypothetical protein
MNTEDYVCAVSGHAPGLVRATKSLTELAPWTGWCKQKPAGYHGILPACHLDEINVAWGALSAEYDTHCSFCRLLGQNGRSWGHRRRFLGHLFAGNWAEGELC